MSTRACLLAPVALVGMLAAQGWSLEAQEPQPPELVGRWDSDGPRQGR